MKVLYLNHNQLNPGHEPEFDINEADFDLAVVNRFPEHYKDDIKLEKNYIRNYSSPVDGDGWAKGNCVIYKRKPDDIEFSDFEFYVEGANENQCKVWQKLCYPGYNIISGFTSYANNMSKTQDPGAVVDAFIFKKQAKEMFDMVDDTTILCTDLHLEDHELAEYDLDLESRGLVNHLHGISAFTRGSGTNGHIDKIITTKNSKVEVSNIQVIKYKREKVFGHWPVTFMVNLTI
jgi:hypothetical protein